ncbi:peptidase E [Cupriavidus necator N-1]|uniref:Peptidase E n=1 Tax=Cupriavidus necator (strain ATCC 43291 / DSM 13513 / CCUG 52238 / LMG 8453 / N-1) TaxID=1042878 RepID=G0EZV8_CUPNN|nr:dipeptidase PepE [Cupriavidus necator]AEI77543.1 peptidase E [Cupriavidus necator N-1]KAI3598226.1 Alpha-aspartyl dipeptidase Peptidase E [Cupriavidus necator H850]MDX6013921.1 dipeptidase PepE [Cupriavidus necator]
MELLLLSNSSSDAGYLVHAQAAIRDLAASRKTACFIPFAGVTRDWDTYETLVRDAFAPVGIAVQSLHRLAEPAAAVRAIEAAELIVVGGGNTFRLLQCLRERGLLAPISAQVRSGAARYIGWSAGANLACPTIRTTNDMPVADPGGLDALALVPFQINPHYFNLVVPGFRGETRDQRLAEFTVLQPDMPVLGLPEGNWVRVSDDRLEMGGAHAARWFRGADIADVQPGALSLPR